jgi:hypothetical protein
MEEEARVGVVIDEKRFPKWFFLVRGGVERGMLIPYSETNGPLGVFNDYSLGMFDYEKGKDVFIPSFDINSVELTQDDEILIRTLNDFGYRISNGGDRVCVRALRDLIAAGCVKEISTSKSDFGVLEKSLNDYLRKIVFKEEKSKLAYV